MHGILPLWKETGMTSHDCVFKLRSILNTKKVGHTGTLDPSVEGVLPICIGNATRLAEYITDAGKEYEAIVSIGLSTTTEDADGEVVEEDTTMKRFSRQQILDAFEQLTGTITQTPPMYSAVKVNGRKLYHYARAGEAVERPSREVVIHSLELLDDREVYEGTVVNFPIRIACGKGTYIRTLSVQIGEILGYPAHMEKLIRSKSGTYVKDECFTLDQLRELKEQGELNQAVRPLESALTEFPKVQIPNGMYVGIQNGQVLPMHPFLNESDKIVFVEKDKAVAIYVAHPTKKGLMKPEKIFPKVH
ncbi:MAG: tRNA pseudouridine(55) synthase TruB [Kurthia sp.]|nr:tRNA pseudouridine(55) synthase TruB [Candidatus Kurthia equi]